MFAENIYQNILYIHVYNIIHYTIIVPLYINGLDFYGLFNDFVFNYTMFHCMRCLVNWSVVEKYVPIVKIKGLFLTYFN